MTPGITGHVTMERDHGNHNVTLTNAPCVSINYDLVSKKYLYYFSIVLSITVYFATHVIWHVI